MPPTSQPIPDTPLCSRKTETFWAPAVISTARLVYMAWGTRRCLGDKAMPGGQGDPVERDHVRCQGHCDRFIPFFGDPPQRYIGCLGSRLRHRTEANIERSHGRRCWFPDYDRPETRRHAVAVGSRGQAPTRGAPRREMTAWVHLIGGVQPDKYTPLEPAPSRQAGIPITQGVLFSMSVELVNTAEELSQIAFGFMGSKALFAGLHIDIFTFRPEAGNRCRDRG